MGTGEKKHQNQAKTGAKNGFPDLLAYEDYRQFLNDYLAAKKRLNPRTSLRGFAQLLKISPTNLSAVLSGKRQFSQERLNEVASRLGFSASETEYFELLGKLTGVPDGEKRARLMQRLKRFRKRTPAQEISQPQFRMIRSWLDFAVLISFRRNKNPKETRNSVEKALGISASEFDQVVERLKNLGLISFDHALSRWVVSGQKLLVDGKQDLLSVLKFHEGWLEWCARNLRIIPKADRFSSSDFISLDERNATKARAILSKALDEIYDLSNQSEPDTNRVYGIGLHFLKLIPRV